MSKSKKSVTELDTSFFLTPVRSVFIRDQLLPVVRKMAPEGNKYEGTQNLLIFQFQSAFLESSFCSVSLLK